MPAVPSFATRTLETRGGTDGMPASISTLSTSPQVNHVARAVGVGQSREIDGVQVGRRKGRVTRRQIPPRGTAAAHSPTDQGDRQQGQPTRMPGRYTL